ncbi:MAG: M23 family metallopeptidase [Synergistaceae bacterium]|jgi:murein DD-endopeptidase MepM/ murein hydrolase activator NlpD|nr:M23 family metallopeptidase [Synergistaceae bacterium]
MKKIFLSIAVGCVLCFLPTPPAVASVSVTFPNEWDVGQAFVVALSSHAAFESPALTWLGKVISLDVEPGREGYVSYGLLGSSVRDVKPDDYPLAFSFTQDGEFFRAEYTVRLNAKAYPEERLTVEDRMLKPPKSEAERIKKEARLAAAARGVMTVERRWTTPPVRPVPGIVTSDYGFRRVYNGVPKGPHAGTDFRAPEGTPVKAVFAGTVVLAEHHYYAGKSVFIDSGNGVIGLFFHLSEISVKKGDRVAKGQVVGKSGSTGRVTGPHLHCGLSLAGQYVDAAPLFETSVTALLKRMKSEVLRP